DGRFIISGSDDNTVRLWDAATGACLYEFQQHSARVVSVWWSKEGQFFFAAAANALIHEWDISNLSSGGQPSALATGTPVRYKHAKALILGESGVGKTALTIRLGGKDFDPTISTDAVRATYCTQPSTQEAETDIEHEVLLMDFAGQWDYQLVNQFFMDQAR